MNVKRDILIRTYLSLLFIVLFGVVIIVQIVRIQFVNGDHWKQLAQQLTTTYVNIEPVRGNIYSADGSLMATSLPIYDIRMDLKTVSDDVFYSGIDSLSLMLSVYFKDKSIAEYKRSLIEARKREARYHLVKRKVPHSQIKDVQKFPIFREGKFAGGFLLEQKSRRIKPFQLLAERTLGYHVQDVSPVGLEGAYNDYLSGVSGKRLMQKLAGGIWIPINDENELDPKNGQDIITTIDVNIQDVTEYALLRELKKHGAAYGCAVVMEVSTGHIKAIANLTRDENGNYQEKYNYAIGESAEPGSTFKLASVMALLEHGLMNPDDTIATGNGEQRFFDRVMRDSREGGYGTITLHQAFQYSSNVAFSRAIQKHYGNNPERFLEFLRAIRLNEQLGIPITGEGKPRIKSSTDKSWSGTTLPWMSIGYEVSLTPLQTLTFYNAVANNGKMMKPVFVTEVRDVGNLSRRFYPEVLHSRIASDKTLKAVQMMMQSVVDSGTATNIRSNRYKIAGKTGTAQIAKAGKGYKIEKLYQASFAGYFPADKPKYSCIVVINSPTSGVFYGSWVAAPVFKDISDKIFAMYPEMYEDKKPVIAQVGFPEISPANINNIRVICNHLKIPYDNIAIDNEWVKPVVRDSNIVFRKNAPDGNQIPDVRGMVLSDAVYLLENMGLHVAVNGTGKVRAQSIKPGTPSNSFKEITLRLN
jgi:cell division protein FtsI (penicillin-binding protein 3)